MYRIKPLRVGGEHEALDDTTLVLSALANSLNWAELEGAASVHLSKTSGFTCLSSGGDTIDCPSVGQPQGDALEALLIAIEKKFYDGHKGKGYKVRILFDAGGFSKIISVRMLSDGFVFDWALQ